MTAKNCGPLTYHLVEEPGRPGLPISGQHVHADDDATVGQDLLWRQADLGAGTAAQETRHGGFEVVGYQILGALVVQPIRHFGPTVVDLMTVVVVLVVVVVGVVVIIVVAVIQVGVNRPVILKPRKNRIKQKKQTPG